MLTSSPRSDGAYNTQCLWVGQHCHLFLGLESQRFFANALSLAVTVGRRSVPNRLHSRTTVPLQRYTVALHAKQWKILLVLSASVPSAKSQVESGSVAASTCGLASLQPGSPATNGKDQAPHSCWGLKDGKQAPPAAISGAQCLVLQIHVSNSTSTVSTT